MNIGRLRKLTIENFRSIGTRLEIPLDASAILIHGANGTGKTSIVSALEFAMTGEIRALRELEPDYLPFVAHHGRTGFVELEVEGSEPHRLEVGKSMPKALAFLNRDDARFFSERVYLAQSLLSRLLDVYESSDKKNDSPLTRFVNDLLGLDALDALIDGLDAAGHVRRLEKLVPELDGARRSLDQLRTRRRVLEAERHAASIRADREVETAVTVDRNKFDLSLGNWRAIPRTQLDELQIELSAIESRIESLPRFVGLAALAKADAESHGAQVALDEWARAGRADIDAAIEACARWLEPITRPSARSIAAVYADVRSRMEERRDLVAAQLADATAMESVIEERGAAINLITSNLSAATASLIDLGEVDLAGELYSLLTELSDHIDGNRCPVCQRDFDEVSDRPLTDVLRERVANHETNVSARAELAANIRRLEVERASLQETMTALKERLASLRKADLPAIENVTQQLRELAPAVSEFEALVVAAEAARSVAASVTAENREFAELERRFTDAFDQLVDPRKPSSEETLPRRVRALRELIDRGISAVDDELRLERLASRRAETIATNSTRMGELREEIETLSRRQVGLESRIKVAEGRMSGARSLAKSAIDTRSQIVNRVFNESLNQTWGDLFKRLAPREEFTPSFVPMAESASRTRAHLVTSDKSGEVAGGPAVMLSAGNVNTAALSLFLALHLTAAPRFPLLVLDDPVQSMDDIHVSQFAALARTFTSQLQRQVVIAVHERELFEYLRLELSPAAKGDHLVTVDLGDGSRDPRIERVSWAKEARLTAS